MSRSFNALGQEDYDFGFLAWSDCNTMYCDEWGKLHFVLDVMPLTARNTEM